MTYQETINRMMRQYPILFPTEEHCLNHLFLVGGNGYWWEDGQMETIVESDEEIEECRNRFHDMLMGRLDGFGDEVTEELHIRIKELIGKPSELRLYPISSIGSMLLDIPDNVKPDWLDAAYRTIDMVLSKAYTHGMVEYWNPENAIRKVVSVRDELDQRFGRKGE